MVHTASVAHQSRTNCGAPEELVYKVERRRQLRTLARFNELTNVHNSAPLHASTPSPSIVSRHSSFGPYNHVNINAQNDRIHAQST